MYIVTIQHNWTMDSTIMLLRIITVLTLLLPDAVFGWNATVSAIRSEQTFLTESMADTGDIQNFIYIKADSTESNVLVECQISSSRNLSTDVCDSGDISIYSGDNHTSSLFIGSFCGAPDPDTFLGSDTAMIIVFNVTALPTNTSFTVKYLTKTVCETSMRATPYPRFLRTPGYPINHLPKENRIKRCLWRVSAPSGHRLRMTLSYASNGYNSNCSDSDIIVSDYDPLLDFIPVDTVWCGVNDNVFVSFTNMTSVRSLGLPYLMYGLQLEFIAEAAERHYKEITLAVGDNGTLTSPGYPTDINELLVYKWNIRAPLSHRQIFQLTVVDMDLDDSFDCTKDSVKIYDRRLLYLPTLVQWCGNTKTTVEFYTTSLVIEFRTGLNHSRNYKGFKINYESPKESGLCGSTLTASPLRERLTSPNYPTPYASSMKCVWKISSLVPEEVVKLDVVRTDLGAETDVFCKSGQLWVYEGHEENDTKLIESWCVDRKRSIQSKGPRLLVVFVSENNAYDRNEGFLMEYWRGQYGKEILASLPYRSVSFPGHGGPYASGYDVFWNISTLSSFYRIGVRFTQMNVSCPTDAITLYDGGVGPGYRNWRFCGTSDRSYFCSTTELFIRFTTQSNKGTGFTFKHKIYYYRGCKADVETVYTSRYHDSYIQPPGNNNYFDKLRCYWRFVSETSSDRVKLVIRSFNIAAVDDPSCTGDYLIVYNGYDTSSKMILRICGKDKRSTVESDTQYLYVEFHSDELNTGQGFRITYSSLYDEIEIPMVNGHKDNTKPVVIGLCVAFLLVFVPCVVIVYIKRRAGNSSTTRHPAGSAPPVQATEMVQSEPVNPRAFDPPPSYCEVENLPPEVKNEVLPPSYIEAVSEGMVEEETETPRHDVTAL